MRRNIYKYPDAQWVWSDREFYKTVSMNPLGVDDEPAWDDWVKLRH